MHLGVALAQVKDEAADVTRLKAVPNCEQKWDHAKKRLLNKETYLKDAFFVSRSLDKVGEKMTWFKKAIAATKKHDHHIPRISCLVLASLVAFFVSASLVFFGKTDGPVLAFLDWDRDSSWCADRPRGLYRSWDGRRDRGDGDH